MMMPICTSQAVCMSRNLSCLLLEGLNVAKSINRSPCINIGYYTDRRVKVSTVQPTQFLSGILNCESIESRHSNEFVGKNQISKLSSIEHLYINLARSPIIVSVLS